MNGLIDNMTAYLARCGERGFLPERREIKLYDNSAGVRFLGDDQGIAANLAIPGVMNAWAAFMLLDAFLESANPALEGKSTRERFLSLPVKNRTDRLVAQVYRMLRVLRIALLHSGGIIEQSRGSIRAAWTGNGTVYTMIITRSGLSLLESFVACFLSSFRQPYGEAYVEALLSQYYDDISGELKKFQDEDAEILRFRKHYEFNRHFRLACGNPRYAVKDACLVFEIADSFYDPLRYPIDFFIVVNEELHIIPVEALTGKKLSIRDLPAWKARAIDVKSASSQFHLEFGYETLSNGGPMS